MHVCGRDLRVPPKENLTSLIKEEMSIFTLFIIHLTLTLVCIRGTEAIEKYIWFMFWG